MHHGANGSMRIRRADLDRWLVSALAADPQLEDREAEP